MAMRLAILSVMAIVGLGLAGCGQQDTKYAEMVDTFNQKLDAKDKELDAARAAQADLQQQVTKLQQEVEDLQARVDATGKQGGIDPRTLAEILDPIIQKSVRNALASQTEAAVPAPTMPRPPEPPQPNMVEHPANNTDDDGNTQHFKFDFGGQ